MARTQNRSSHSIRVKQRVPIEVRQAKFKAFKSVQYLNIARLERAANARFEVGQFEAGCCHRTVHAIVRKGKVIKLEIESCTKTKPVRMTSDLKKMILAARKAVAARHGGSQRLPMAVGKFVANLGRFTIEVFGCFQICIFGWCLLCCYWPDEGFTCDFFEE